MPFNFLKNLDADDIFISYSRDDGEAYLTGLDAALSAKGFSCFTDKRGTEAGRLPPASLFAKVRRCKTLVLLATPEALVSPENIAPEVKEFADANGTARIVCVSFDRGAEFANWSETPWFSLVEGKAREREDAATLTTGEPSAVVVNEIAKVSDYMKSKDRLALYRRRAEVGFVALLVAGLIALGFALVASYRAKQARAQASIARVEADNSIAKSNEDIRTARNRANDEIKQAKENAQMQILDAQNDAKVKITEANALASEADRKRLTADAQKTEAEGLRDAARAEAGRLGTIAESRSLADRSQKLLRRRPEALQRSIGFAMEAVRKSADLAHGTLESDTALREGLRLVPTFIKPTEYSGEVNALSPDGQHFASLADDETVRIFEVGNQIPLKEITQVKGNVLALNSGGSIVATASEGTIKIRDVVKGVSVAIVIESPDPDDPEISVIIEGLALSPKGKYLGVIYRVQDLSTQSGMADMENGINNVGLWEVASGKKLTDLSTEQRHHAIAFGPDGDFAVGAGLRLCREFSGFTGVTYLWHFSRRFMGFERDDTLDELQANDFSSFDSFQQGPEVLAIAVGPQGTSYATDQAIFKRDVTGAFEEWLRFPVREGEPDHIARLAFTADGKQIYVVRLRPRSSQQSETPARFYPIVESWQTTQQTAGITIFSPKTVTNLGFLTEGSSLLTASGAGEGRSNVYDPQNHGAQVGVPQDSSGAASGQNREVRYLSRDARFIVSTSDDSAFVSDVSRPSPWRVSWNAELERVDGATLSDNGEYLALLGSRGGEFAVAIVYKLDGQEVRLFKSLVLTNVRSVQPLGASPTDLEISDNGQRLVTLSEGVVQVWDMNEQREVTPSVLQGLKEKSLIKLVTSIELSPGAQYLAVGYHVNPVEIDEYGELVTDPEDDYVDADVRLRTTDAAVIVVRLSDGRQMSAINYAGEISSMVFSEDANFLLASGYDRVTFLTNLTNWGKWVVPKTDSVVKTAAFSSDDQLFALGQEGSTLVFALSDLEQELAALPETGEVTAIAFSSDNRFIATATNRDCHSYQDPAENHPLRVWLLRPDDLLQDAEFRLQGIPEYLRQ